MTRSYDHALFVCQYHADPINSASDLKWASRWLSRQVQDEILTAEEANQIRREVGWTEVPEQLGLFRGAK